jgi:hypothetical protein
MGYKAVASKDGLGRIWKYLYPMVLWSLKNLDLPKDMEVVVAFLRKFCPSMFMGELRPFQPATSHI